MNEIPHFPQSISHKKLTKFMLNAQKDDLNCSIDEESINSSEYENYKELLEEWELISKEMLSNLAKKDIFNSQNRSSRSLMALGAMEAHLSMAMQALKASQED